MRQRIYLVLIALLCVFIFYLLFLNGFRLFPDQTVGSDKAKDQTGLQENVIDQEPDSPDERWFQATTKKTKPTPSTSRPFIYTRTSTEKSTQNTDIPTSKIIDETSTIKYETEETTTEPAIEDEVEHSTTQAHRHHTHRPHHDRKGHKHHHHTTASRMQTSTSTETPPVFYDQDFTVVTALIDIGRGKWNEYRRPLEKYHEFMENLLSLKNKMVIFVDESSIDFVQKYREKLGLMHQTLIHPAEFSDLPLHKYLDDAKKIIESEKANPQLYGVRWDAGMKSHPEANKAEYDVLVNSKTYFLYNVTLENPFDTEYFVWLDAGYGHGNQSVFPYDNMWRAAFPERKVSLIKAII
ncbi:hypothetical protein WR25_06398 isoform C [Diploscapter pachys]|uniref:Uncharacterized protein n=1 Tax=Diploscapter pachys TaxID=2018661 RepID=A0A2A2LYU8_9BILA|nr:hypothetical protein WR25_06398 isoform A [Diploscapter pachys]PAV91416.1 hypothetical protein WR25_06398 isoform C [Diploscapter pachys]